MSPVHAFLRGDGPDGRGRKLADVLAFDDAALEAHHDYIQWLFPLREPSRAVPGSPVISDADAVAIRADSQAQDGFAAGLSRMMRFYSETDHWLVAFDHNHLRISRIIAATRDLLGVEEASAFHSLILSRDARGAVDRSARRYWAAAAAKA